MIAVRPAAARGRCAVAALESRCSFSHGDYHDPAHMGFGALRLLNEQVVAPGAALEPQRYANLEVLTWVVSGSLRCREGDAAPTVLAAGTLECVGGGSGLEREESNASAQQSAHLVRLGLRPDRVNAAPRIERRVFTDAQRRGRLCLLAAADGDGLVHVRQNVRLSSALLARGETIEHRQCYSRRAWLQVVSGELIVNGIRLAGGDGAAVIQECGLHIEAASDTDLLLLELD